MIDESDEKIPFYSLLELFGTFTRFEKERKGQKRLNTID